MAVNPERFGGHRKDPGLTPAGSNYHLTLLGTCRLSRGDRPIPLKPREQRVVALLALQGNQARSRCFLAGRLWPEVTQARAGGSLRSAVFGLHRAAPGLLWPDGGQLGLAPGVSLDVRRLAGRARLIIGLAQQCGEAEEDPQLPPDSLSLLSQGELLPGWYEDWVSDERDRLQQLQLSALESLAELLLDRGDVSDALAAAGAAAELDPLRESAQRAVVRIHLANGNYHAAVSHYLRFRRTVLAELGIGPSMQMERLIRPIMDHSRRGRRAEDVRPVQSAGRPG